MRYHSEEEFQAAVLTRAKQIWAEVERAFPAHIRQPWERGTQLARAATLAQARAEILSQNSACGRGIAPL